MKKIFIITSLCLLLTGCVKENYVVLDKECIHHTFSSDNYYLILQRIDGEKISYPTTEQGYVLYNIGDTIELYK